jgi:hypothetical protein
MNPYYAKLKLTLSSWILTQSGPQSGPKNGPSANKTPVLFGFLRLTSWKVVPGGGLLLKVVSFLRHQLTENFKNTYSLPIRSTQT